MDENEENEENDALYGEIRLDDELYVEQLAAHPEYQEFFEKSEGLDDVLMDETGQEVSPHLHLMTHVILEKQLRSDDPPCVRKTVARLEARGEDPHDARHAVMAILVELMWECMTEQKPFEAKRYEKQLKGL